MNLLANKRAKTAPPTMPSPQFNQLRLIEITASPAIAPLGVLNKSVKKLRNRRIIGEEANR